LIMGLSPIRVVRSASGDEFFQCYQMPPCPPNPRSRRRKFQTSIATMIPAAIGDILLHTTRVTKRATCHDSQSRWLGPSASSCSRSARRPANAPAFRRNARSKLAANVIPILADGFMEGIWESSPAAPRLPSTTAFRASCLKSAGDRKLLVGFSDDRRFFLQLLLLLLVLFFVLFLILALMSRSRCVTP